VPGVEEALQNQHGSDLVDDLAVGFAGAAGGVEMAVGFGGGEAFVPEVDGESEGFAEDFGKNLGSGGLGAEVAGKVEGIAQDDGGAVEFPEQSGEGLEILTEVAADEGEHRLGGEAQLVGDGNADTASAIIESEQARGHQETSSIVARAQEKGRILQ
jgi:hypothetical protein